MGRFEIIKGKNPKKLSHKPLKKGITPLPGTDFQIQTNQFYTLVLPNGGQIVFHPRDLSLSVVMGESGNPMADITLSFTVPCSNVRELFH